MKSNADQNVLAQAIAHHKAGRLDVAEHLYRAVLALDDEQAEAHHHLGVLEIERGHLDTGLNHLQRALESAPETGQYWQSFAEALLLAQRPDEALTVIDQALASGLDTPVARDLHARITAQINESTQGADSALGLVNTADSATHFSAERESYRQTERDRLLDLLRTGQLAHAKALARELTETAPESALGWKVLGTLLVRDDDSQAALSVLEEARRLDPRDGEILNSLGQACQALDRLDDAVDLYRKALDLKPDLAEIWYNQGMVKQELGQLEEALSSYDQAILLQPGYAKAHNNRGTVLRELDRPEEALTCHKRALLIQPDSADAFNNLALALQDLGRLDDALTSLDDALAVRPDFAAALNNRGNLLKDLGCLDEAMASYERALEIKPNFIVALQNRLLCLNYQADLSHERIFAEHRAFEYDQASKVAQLPPFMKTDRDPDRQLRIGLVSGDFRQHSVAFFLLPVLERLDRRRFQVNCYSTRTKQDDFTRAFRQLADGWVESSGMGHRALAERIRQDGIDLLLDLSGQTDGNALLAFAARPAPIQITWIGYPNTTGLTAMDYRLVDALTDPAGKADTFHSERLIRLPSGFLCYRPLESGKALPVGPLPSLKKGRITFGSFNILAKLTPITLNLWTKLLQTLPDADLRLKSYISADIAIWNRVLAHFVAQGIEPRRIEILPRASSYQEHLALYQDIDIALDTFPYHGTTTTCEALFMGVPVVTLAGDRHASRVGVSLLTQVELPELIAMTPESYVRIARNLATDRVRLSGLRVGLRERLDRSPLRDEVGFTRTLETALRQMWRIWCAGEEPRVFEISASTAIAESPLAGVAPSLDSRRVGKALKKRTKPRAEPCVVTRKQPSKKDRLKDARLDSPTVAEEKRVLALFNEERYAEAEVVARKLTDRYPEAMFGWKSLGTILVKSKQYQAALPLLLEANRLASGASVIVPARTNQPMVRAADPTVGSAARTARR